MKFRAGEEDGALLRAMRMQFAYWDPKEQKWVITSKCDNSLIEWTLSEAWSNPAKEPWNYSKACANIRYSHYRAELVFVNTTNMVHVPVIRGEFEVRNLEREMK